MNFQDRSLETNFGCRLNVHATSMDWMPATTANTKRGTILLGASPVVTVLAPAAMLAAKNQDGEDNTRMGWLVNDGEHVGVSMAYIGRHFAAALHDLGEVNAQEMLRAALDEDCTRFYLRCGEDKVLVVPGLTSACRQAFQNALGARPTGFSSFMQAASSVAESLTRAETFRSMGLDAERLRSVTLSVCLPTTVAVELEVREASHVRPRTKD